MIVLGVDWSLTSPAITSHDTETKLTKFFAFKQRKKDESHDENLILLDYPEFTSDEDRYHQLASRIFNAIKTNHGIPSKAFFESYAFGGSGAVFNIAESTGIMKNTLHINGCTVEKIAPTAIKKFATQSGKATKRNMLSAFMNEGLDPFKMLDVLDKGGEKIPSPISDIVDSYFALKAGLSTMPLEHV